MTSDDRDRERSGGLAAAIRRLVETARELEAEGKRFEHRSRDARSRGSHVEYGYSVRVGLGGERDDGRRPNDGRRPRSDRRPEDGRDRDERSPRTDRPVSVRPTADGAVVSVDLPDVDPETLAAGVTGRRLTVASDGEPVARVDLPSEGRVVGGATYNNGVLEIEIDAEGDSDGGVTTR
ncbi:gas vesicle protein GvpH [Halegenticoccus tardaugens]|uniref:gas vesicle protein GvpH n=1 Tax=Halegenticoccus tardaugens TaxID=2071624 RepID=UPI00100B3F0A|nr:gas vesicle protein GvpH [Halegenticoccus tardaugens]